ncbi:MAG: phospholipase D-like domain-containing protein [Gammaproteobacteria bacterium]
MHQRYQALIYTVFLFFILSLPTHADQLIIEPDAGRAPLLSAIKNAQSSVNLVLYGFTDNNFIAALIAAKNQGKNVQVLLEPTPYKAENENTNAIQQFRIAKVNLEWPNKFFKLTHQKTFIIDQKYAIVMTFNLTNSSFSRERNFALLLTDPAMVQEISQVFSADWMHKIISVNQPNLVWSPNNSREKILAFIQSATSDIKIYAQDISDYRVVGALAKAARLGRRVEILTSIYPQQSPNKKLAYLQNAGVIIHNSNHYLIHAKVILIDHKRALLGSINLTKPSLDDNRELSVITEDAEVINQLDDTFAHDWSETELTRRSNMSHHNVQTTKQMLRVLKRVYRQLNTL